DYDLTPFGPWYGDLYSSIDATLSSLQTLRGIPASVRITGHERGLFAEPPGELWKMYEGVVYERERKLLEMMDRPVSLDEIVAFRILYKKPREPKAFFEFGERAHMKKHLERLIATGAVVCDGTIYSKA
ncbi:MAG: hypothetical protein PHY31_10440, partial [Smithellaceae bacterium]|nr:hypothetical protein [Smithellaceae bacterium]